MSITERKGEKVRGEGTRGEGVGEIKRQKERSARTAGKPTDQFVLCANREP